MRHRIFRLLLCLLYIGVLTGCHEPGGPSRPSLAPPPSASLPNRGADPIAENAFTTPVLMVSAGRSTDLYVLQTILRQAGLRRVLTAPSAIPEEITPYYGSILIAVGGSAKGMGAAGVDLEHELEHVTQLIDAAQALDIPILAAHIGGEARRGELSDSLIQMTFQAADAAVILAEGDYDEFMLGLVEEQDIPATYVEDLIDVADVMKSIFQQEPLLDP